MACMIYHRAMDTVQQRNTQLAKLEAKVSSTDGDLCSAIVAAAVATAATAVYVRTVLNSISNIQCVWFTLYDRAQT